MLTNDRALWRILRDVGGKCLVPESDIMILFHRAGIADILYYKKCVVLVNRWLIVLRAGISSLDSW